MIGVITNIEEEKKHRRTLEKAADLDGFTGLYNKTASIARIKMRMVVSREFCRIRRVVQKCSVLC